MLTLEVTESLMLHDPQRAGEVLADLKELGVSLALDDFGTGYSSLEHLKRLPVNELKIDKSFVMSMDRDPADRAIVASTAALGRSLGLRVVAEGVESAASASVLAAIGCDLAQGFHYSPPVPPDQLPALVRAAIDAQVGTANIGVRPLNTANGAVEPKELLRGLTPVELRREAVRSLRGVGAGSRAVLPRVRRAAGGGDAVEERRKVVTVVFADVVGSTALGERVDPETLRWAMQRWFHRMGQAVERHGGTIEDYRGDGVMAVFGIPVAHEDDALRAARAALDMREAGRELGDAARGRAAGADRAQHRPGRDRQPRRRRLVHDRRRGQRRGAAGAGRARRRDPARRATRIRLVEHAVEAEAIEPLTVKGKRRRDRRLPPARGRRRPRRAAAAHRARRWSTARTSGRASCAAFERASGARACELCTVVGSPGVGKSRLVAELAEHVLRPGDRRQRPLPALRRDAHVVAARGGARRERAAGRARRRRAPGDPARGRAAGPAGDPVAPDEAQWALRVVLERLARRRPLVLAVDDLQWADPPFLDLLDHLTEAVRDAPLLLLGTARPELFDDRPGLARQRRPAAPAARRARGRRCCTGSRARRRSAPTPATASSRSPRATRCSSSSSSRWPRTAARR